MSLHIKQRGRKHFAFNTAFITTHAIYTHLPDNYFKASCHVARRSAEQRWAYTTWELLRSRTIAPGTTGGIDGSGGRRSKGSRWSIFFLILVQECHSDEPEPLVDLRSLQTFYILTLLQRREAERTEINEEEKYKVLNSFFEREQSISAFALRHKFRKMRRRQKKGHEKGGCYIKFVVVVRYQYISIGQANIDTFEYFSPLPG